eukprot:252817-Chlamydomonas_euryale.AAC.4
MDDASGAAEAAAHGLPADWCVGAACATRPGDTGVSLLRAFFQCAHFPAGARAGAGMLASCLLALCAEGGGGGGGGRWPRRTADGWEGRGGAAVMFTRSCVKLGPRSQRPRRRRRRLSLSASRRPRMWRDEWDASAAAAPGVAEGAAPRARS